MEWYNVIRNGDDSHEAAADDTALLQLRSKAEKQNREDMSEMRSYNYLPSFVKCVELFRKME